MSSFRIIESIQRNPWISFVGAVLTRKHLVSAVVLVLSINPIIAYATEALTQDDLVQNTATLSADHIDAQIEKMSLREKVGQMSQRNLSGITDFDSIPSTLKEEIRRGEVGSIINAHSLSVVNQLQRFVLEEGNGIPLLIARDVIHGYKTVFPIPLGQAASWNPDIVQRGARTAAVEASADGIRWTFAPMIDIVRDPRWGRVAESFGEDPYLSSVMAVASVRGYQGDRLSDPDSLAACAKHFLGYGAAEGGRDYNTTYIPEPLLQNVYLPPFQAAVDAGVATVMSAFNDLNGVPASVNAWLLDDVLRKHVGFSGVIVSDWESIVESIVHGVSENEREAAHKAMQAGLDIEMVSRSYINSAESLLAEGDISEAQINRMVKRVLTLKRALGLFDNAYTDPKRREVILHPSHLAQAKESAIKSLVLLKNDVVKKAKANNNHKALPLKQTETIALIGPMADAPYDQLGTWTMDGEKQHSVTLLEAMQKRFANKHLRYSSVLPHTRSYDRSQFKKAVKLAKKADKIVLVLGEEASLTGEAHSRANIRLPGAQEALIETLAALNKPLIVVLMAGRQLALDSVLDKIDTLIMAWHPGTMGGEAIAEVLLGEVSPSGRLPVSWPKVSGQVPLYYNEKNTGRPAHSRPFTYMADFPIEARQETLGHATHYIDIGFEPQFPFGFGLSYTQFQYADVILNTDTALGTVTASARIKNMGRVGATETVQLYIRDLTASITRPVKELKGFQQVYLLPGEEQKVSFTLNRDSLTFVNASGERVYEQGKYHLWIAPNASEGKALGFFL